MKIAIPIAALFIALAVQRCEKDTEDETGITAADETGYTAEDIRMRQAHKDWERFRRDADSIVMAGRIQISEAADCYEDPRTPHRGRLKTAIIRAEEKLEKLSDKMLKARKYAGSYLLWDEGTIKEMQAFEDDFSGMRQQLDEALLELRQYYPTLPAE